MLGADSRDDSEIRFNNLAESVDFPLFISAHFAKKIFCLRIQIINRAGYAKNCVVAGRGFYCRRKVV